MLVQLCVCVIARILGAKTVGVGKCAAALRCIRRRMAVKGLLKRAVVSESTVLATSLWHGREQSSSLRVVDTVLAG